jgi:hypothetical protein
MPVVEPLLARLDRATGLRVLCGGAGNTCTGEFGRIEVVGESQGIERGAWRGSAAIGASLGANRAAPLPLTAADLELMTKDITKVRAVPPPSWPRIGDRLLTVLDGWQEGIDEQGKRRLSQSRHTAQRGAWANAAVRRGALDPAMLEARRRPRDHLSGSRAARRNGSLASWGGHAPIGATRKRAVPLGTDGILMDCPRCGKTNLLTPSALRITPAVRSTT